MVWGLGEAAVVLFLVAVLDVAHALCSAVIRQRGPQKGLYPKDLFTHAQSTDLEYGEAYSLSTATGIVLGSMQ